MEKTTYLLFFNCKFGIMERGEFKDFDFEDIRQPEVAIWPCTLTGCTHISESMIDIVEITTTNL